MAELDRTTVDALLTTTRGAQTARRQPPGAGRGDRGVPDARPPGADGGRRAELALGRRHRTDHAPGDRRRLPRAERVVRARRARPCDRRRDASTLRVGTRDDRPARVGARARPRVRTRTGRGCAARAGALRIDLPRGLELPARAAIRGLGTTPLYVADEPAIAALVGAPPTARLASLLPVAYFTGYTFQPARAAPTRRGRLVGALGARRLSRRGGVTPGVPSRALDRGSGPCRGSRARALARC